MRIIALDASGLSARCEAWGSEREVSLLMVQDGTLAVGDYVSVSLGQAVQKVTPEEAQVALAYYATIFAVLDA
jgi:hydrogenase maturation factor